MLLILSAVLAFHRVIPRKNIESFQEESSELPKVRDGIKVQDAIEMQNELNFQAAAV